MSLSKLRGENHTFSYSKSPKSTIRYLLTIVARLVIGWVCDRVGPRVTYTWLLLLGALPVIGIGLANSYASFLLFRLAIAAGSETLPELCAATRAGTGCGTCRPEVAALLARFAGTPLPADEPPPNAGAIEPPPAVEELPHAAAEASRGEVLV